MLFWTLVAFFLAAAYAHDQDDFTDTCPLHQNGMKKILVENKQQCISAGVKTDRLQEAILNLANDLMTRDNALQQLVQENKEELKSFVEEKSNQYLELISDLNSTFYQATELQTLVNEEEGEKNQPLLQLAKENQDELIEVVKENAFNFMQAMVSLKYAHQQELQKLANESEARNFEFEQQKIKYDKLHNEATENATQYFEEISKLRENLDTNERRFQKIETEAKARDDTILSLRKYVEDITNQTHQSIPKLDTDIRDFVNQSSEPKNSTDEDELHKQKQQEQEACLTWKETIGNLEITKLNNSAYYHFNKNRQSWQNAQTFCKSRGISLAVFESKEEIKLVNAARPDTFAYWVGASDVSHEPGDFHWTDKTIVDSAWRRNRTLYGAGKETCLDLYRSKLEDDPCIKKYHSICKVASEYVHCL